VFFAVLPYKNNVNIWNSILFAEICIFLKTFRLDTFLTEDDYPIACITKVTLGSSEEASSSIPLSYSPFTTEQESNDTDLTIVEVSKNDDNGSGDYLGFAAVFNSCADFLLVICDCFIYFIF
jgi:hypothetical protein